LLATLVSVTFLFADPDPYADIAVGVFLFRPGCDGPDYFFSVKNLSTVYEYKIIRTGRTGIECAPGCDGPCPTLGMGGTGSSCINSWPGTEEVLETAGNNDCTQTTPVSPGFPHVCDNDEGSCECECESGACDLWCATITNAKVRVTAYREAGQGSWIPFDPVVTRCEGLDFGSGPGTCPAHSKCLDGFYPGGCVDL
jgi:hypothetical protein